MKIITKTLAIILLAFLSNNLYAESGLTYQDEIFTFKFIGTSISDNNL